ncbi:hypothetical protein RND81_03G101000 [Saponaria officinalis]|uniref:FMN-binding split barrel n=1 Tax=Saponaria officinalis TaxID=3572 RepID=A0AAW1M7I8_SAPOF
MKVSKSNVLTIASKCKNILASNWQGNLNTIKADSKGSKQDIYTSKVKYLVKRGKPYIWVPEKDLHNVNTLVDERASFAVASPHPGPLANIFRSIKKLPARIALTGEVFPLEEDKVKSINESLQEMIIAEQTEIAESNYVVSGVLSSTFGSTARSENLVELLDTDESYVVYKFSPSSCTFIDGNGGNHEVNLDDFEKSKSDKLSPLATKLIDGINQSEMRRRALVVICFTFLNVHARDAYVQSVDCKGFDVLAKVTGDNGEYQWKEYRLTLNEEAHDVESFCCRLVQMEEAALDKIKSLSGLG